MPGEFVELVTSPPSETTESGNYCECTMETKDSSQNEMTGHILGAGRKAPFDSHDGRPRYLSGRTADELV